MKEADIINSIKEAIAKAIAEQVRLDIAAIRS